MPRLGLCHHSVCATTPFVKGHGFSRAIKGPPKLRALALEVNFYNENNFIDQLQDRRMSQCRQGSKPSTHARGPAPPSRDSD